VAPRNDRIVARAVRSARARAIGVVALVGAVASVPLACASILGIGEAAFAELESGVVADGPMTETADAGGPDAVDGGNSDGGEAGGQQCSPASTIRCPGECLDTACSKCRHGTTNVAPLGTAHADSMKAFYPAAYLNDRKLAPSWVAFDFTALATPPYAVWIDLPAGAEVTEVTAFAHRGGPPSGTSRLITLRFELLGSAGTALRTFTMSPDSNGDVYWRLTTPVANVRGVRVGIIDAAGSTPAIAEIEICGN